MRRAVRRLTWILLSLGLMTVLAFGLLSRLVPDHRNASLPLYLNLEPRNVRDLSLAAFERLKRDPSSTAAAGELSRLGGAALPFVLPELENLDAELRERVALAMTPIALRMEAAVPEELATGRQAAAFWLRYWQDRSVDFREPVVRRLVERLSQRSLILRREDVLELDTYALPALIDALGTVRNEDDVRRTRRLTSVLAHVADQPFVVDRAMTPAEARRVVRQWRRFWEDHGADFTPLDGPHRLTAMVTQTAYGRWLASVLRGEFGRLNDGGTGLDLLREAAPRTLPRLGLVPVLAALIAAAFAASIWKAAPTLSLPLLLAGLGLAGVPMLALLLHQQAAGAGVLVVLLGLSQGTALGLSAASRSRSLEAQQALGLRGAALVALALLGPAMPFVASTVIGGECALGLPGLGDELKRALVRSDLHAAMAVALCCALGAAVTALLADGLRALLSTSEATEEEAS
jgi:ABC-type dipeptide/oligopeptide/nickel transport system permease component